MKIEFRVVKTRSKFMRFTDWLYSLLPDHCEMRGHGCLRLGVRGNENIVNGKILCDNCSVRLRHPPLV